MNRRSDFQMFNTHLEEVCGTNYVPTDAEVLEIREFLAEPLSRLANLDEEISITEQKVRDLRQRREDLLEGIERYRRLTSPVRRLPPDVLCEIFIHCLAEDHNSSMSAQDAPMLLTRICSQWRGLALTTTRLWASLHIPVPNASPVFEGSYDPKSGERLALSKVMELRTAAVREWIKRSGTLPLSFSINEHDGFPPTDYCKEFIRCILPYRHRWKSIKMICGTASFLEIAAVPASEFPLLKSLSLCLFRPNQTIWKDIPIFQASSIQEISFIGINSHISDFPLSWPRLTKICIKENSWNTNSPPSLDGIYRVLENCTNLVSCELHISSDANTQLTSFPTIHLPHLESMTIRDDLGARILYAAMDAPCIRKLHYLGLGNGRRVSGGEALNQLLKNVGHGLHELKITSRTFKGNLVLDNLKLCPILKSLSIISSSLEAATMHSDQGPATFIDQFLGHLGHASNDAQYVCPNLEVFECLNEAHFSDEALFEFILRKQSGEDLHLAPLKSVSVLFRRQATMDIPAALKGRIPAGLNLDIKYPPRHYRGPFSLYEGLAPPVKQDPYLQIFWTDDTH